MDKEKEYTEAFAGLDSHFGSTYEMEDSELENEVVVSPMTPTAPFLESNGDSELEDSDFISSELKMTIESISDVMTKLDEDLKIGAPPRMFEVYAKLADSKINAISKLTEKSKAKLDAKVKLKSASVPHQGSTTNNIILSSKDLLKELISVQPKTNTNVKVIQTEQE